MKKLIAIFTAVALVLLAPGVAEATTSVTFHLTGVAIDVGPAGCGLAGDLFLTGNYVGHETINDAGDIWITETAEGAATASGFSGHGAAWFGLEANRSNVVTHFTGNAIGTTSDGTPLTIHVDGQFTLNANLVPVVTRVTFTCG